MLFEMLNVRYKSIMEEIFFTVLQGFTVFLALKKAKMLLSEHFRD
jgi:hypothetical protein